MEPYEAKYGVARIPAGLRENAFTDESYNEDTSWAFTSRQRVRQYILFGINGTLQCEERCPQRWTGCFTVSTSVLHRQNASYALQGRHTQIEVTAWAAEP